MSISEELAEALTGPTAWRFEGRLGPVFTPRFFCCTDPNELGLVEGKEPVAVIELTPNPAHVGENVAYDGSDSYDPDGSITAYSWSFEGHSPASSSTATGTLNYAAAGTYTIQLVVTDGTSKRSSPARVELEVKPPLFAGYVSSEAGVFYADGSDPIVWEDRNFDIAAEGLMTRAVVIDPATQDLAETEKTIWRGNLGGIYVSNDGGQTWTQKNPDSVTNAWADTPAPNVSDLTYSELLFTGNRLIVVATWQNDTNLWRSWLFETSDFGTVRSYAAAPVIWIEHNLD